MLAFFLIRPDSYRDYPPYQCKSAFYSSIFFLKYNGLPTPNVIEPYKYITIFSFRTLKTAYPFCSSGAFSSAGFAFFVNYSCSWS